MHLSNLLHNVFCKLVSCINPSLSNTSQGISLSSIFLGNDILDYIDFFIEIFVALEIFFQFPFLIIILYYFNFLSIGLLVKYRSIFIVCFFIISAILTPPDIFSQLIFGFFVLILYEVSIFINFLIDYFINHEKSK